MATDEIDRAAQTILIMGEAYFGGGVISENPIPSHLFTSDDLQAMAKLWLMRDELERSIQHLLEDFTLDERTTLDDVYGAGRTTLDKLKQLGE